MSSTWESYYVLFLSSLLALGIPLSLVLLSFLLNPFTRAVPKKLPKSGDRPSEYLARPNFNQRINIRFFLSASAALVLIMFGIELIPCVTTIQSESSADLFRSLLAVITLASFASLGLLYSVRKGNMDWLTSYNVKNPSHKDRE